MLYAGRVIGDDIISQIFMDQQAIIYNWNTF